MSQSGPPADAKQAQSAALTELENAQRKKRAIDTTLANLETSIWAFEGSYLEETAASGGNIIKGFDSYLKPPAAGNNKKKAETTEADRLFSASSVAFQQNLNAARMNQASHHAANAAQTQAHAQVNAHQRQAFPYATRSSHTEAPRHPSAHSQSPSITLRVPTTPAVPPMVSRPCVASMPPPDVPGAMPGWMQGAYAAGILRPMPPVPQASVDPGIGSSTAENPCVAFVPQQPSSSAAVTSNAPASTTAPVVMPLPTTPAAVSATVSAAGIDSSPTNIPSEESIAAIVAEHFANSSPSEPGPQYPAQVSELYGFQASSQYAPQFDPQASLSSAQYAPPPFALAPPPPHQPHSVITHPPARSVQPLPAPPATALPLAPVPLSVPATHEGDAPETSVPARTRTNSRRRRARG